MSAVNFNPSREDRKEWNYYDYLDELEPLQQCLIYSPTWLIQHVLIRKPHLSNTPLRFTFTELWTMYPDLPTTTCLSDTSNIEQTWLDKPCSNVHTMSTVEGVRKYKILDKHAQGPIYIQCPLYMHTRSYKYCTMHTHVQHVVQVNQLKLIPVHSQAEYHDHTCNEHGNLIQ